MASFITRYEVTKVIGVRAEMLARGHPPLVTLTDDMKRNGMYDPKIVAAKEYERGLLSFKLRRTHPDNRVVVVSLSKAGDEAEEDVTQKALQ
jgi:DNA-directed RNA polymerase subunit K/omega